MTWEYITDGLKFHYSQHQLVISHYNVQSGIRLTVDSTSRMIQTKLLSEKWRGDTMNLHQLTGFLVHRTDVKMTNYFMRTLRPYDITPDQWGIICILDTERAVNQKQLAEAIDRDQTTVVRMIHSLERKEMIEKVANLEDKRSHHLYLSTKGADIKKKLLTTVQEAHDYVTRGFTIEEIEQLQSFLNRLYINVMDEE